MKRDPNRTRHETGTAYNKGCRCPTCIETNKTRLRRGRASMLARTKKALAARHKERIPAKHGLYTTYVNWGCRCKECTKAQIAKYPNYIVYYRANQKRLKLGLTN